MLNKIVFSILCFFAFSCHSIELPKESSNEAKIYSNIILNISENINKDKVYLNYIKTNLKLNEEFISQKYTLSVFEEENTRVELFKNKNSNNNKLLIVANGGSFLNPYKEDRRSFYLDDISDKLGNYDVMICDYHMGLQHRYPIQNKDLLNSYRLSLKLGYNPSDIVFIGDSSGGNIIVSSMIYLVNNNLPTPAAVVLLSPYLDATNSLESRERNKKKDIFFGTQKEKINSDFLSYMPYFLEEKNLKDPYISPIFVKDIKGFPKTLITVGSYEILEDDSKVFYKILKENGNDVELKDYPGMIHVFQMFGLKESNDSLEYIVDFIKNVKVDKKVVSKDMINNIRFDVELNNLSQEEIDEKIKNMNLNLIKLIEEEKDNFIENDRNYLNIK